MTWFVVRSHWRISADAAPSKPVPPFDLLVTRQHLVEASGPEAAMAKVRRVAARQPWRSYDNAFGARVKTRMLGWQAMTILSEGLVDLIPLDTGTFTPVARRLSDDALFAFTDDGTDTHARLLEHQDHFVEGRARAVPAPGGKQQRDNVALPGTGTLRAARPRKAAARARSPRTSPRKK